ncbi:MAG: hypothetical protein K6C12_05405 [Oscillospiraceae bacterium]|nr:hypothetical protein [Oscillospiraceae bacterium]
MFSGLYPGKQTVAFPPSKDHSPLAEAKRLLGLDPDALHLVALVSNTPGDFLSDLLSMIYVCDEHDSEISILCASNGSLYQKLDEEIGHLESIHLYDKESDGRKLLDSADLMLTEGQDSVLAEALKRQLPLVLIGTPEQEAWSYLMNQGCAVSSQDNVELAEYCVKLLDDAALRAKMSGAYWR